VTQDADSPINAAIRNFEAAEANLEKLERLFKELREMIPDGIVFGSNMQYDELRRAYSDVLDALPAIEGWKPASTPIDLNDLAHWRLDAREIDEISAVVSAEEAVDTPARELSDYRHRLNKKRRQLIRAALTDIIARVDEVIRSLRERYKDSPDRGRKLEDSALGDLERHVQEIETMLGSSLPRPERWADLRRHIYFGQVGDLLDIVELDWPKVKAGLSAGLYDRNEPVPVAVSDLGVLAATQPRGTVATRLRWESLSAEDFERLLFSLISGVRGYENPEWLMRTNARDRGRDLSVTRVANDPLGGVIRSRVIIQCKHWSDKSVSVADAAELQAQMKLWEPPRVDVLVIATSGRFSSDAVSWIEKHNTDDHALRIEMWPESHLERLLAERPALIADFRLR
jgi:tetratricopeptide (TPR) repeat protein